MLKDLDVNTVMLLIIALANFGGLVIGIVGRKEQTTGFVNTAAKLDVLKAQTDGMTTKLVQAEKDRGEVKAAQLVQDNKAIAADNKSTSNEEPKVTPVKTAKKPSKTAKKP